MRGAYGETLLHAAFLFRQGDVVKYLVANHKELINVPYNDLYHIGPASCYFLPFISMIEFWVTYSL